jgi:hypothetical protein
VAPPRAPTSSQLLAPRPLGCVVAVAMVDLTLVKGVAERAQSHRVIVALNVQLAAARMRASLRPALPGLSACSTVCPDSGLLPLSLSSAYEARACAQDYWTLERHRVAVARCLISCYFFNVWFTSLQIWMLGRARFPVLLVFLVIPTVCLVLDYRTKVIGLVLMVEVLKDSAQLLLGVFRSYLSHGVWYLNELMVKKLSMLGTTFLLLLMASADSKKNPLAGLLMEGACGARNAGALASDGASAMRRAEQRPHHQAICGSPRESTAGDVAIHLGGAS